MSGLDLLHAPPAVAIVNESSRLADADLDTIVEALTLQLARDVLPAWWSLPFPISVVRGLDQVGPAAFPLVVLDTPDQAGALGYHSETPDGRPYGRVFVSPTLDAGGTILSGPNAVSVTLSHEVIELVGDLSCNLWAERADGSQVARELADPVEGDAYDIALDGGRTVSVSNFVLPAWFSPRSPQGVPTDYLGKLFEPFAMTPGGYMIVRSTSGEVGQVFGSLDAHAAFTAKLGTKIHPAGRTARRGALG